MKKALLTATLLAMALGVAGCNEATEKQSDESSSASVSSVVESSTDEESAPQNEIITDEQARAAIQNYCCINNPSLKDNEEELPTYWEVVSSSETEIVVLFRSYTGAQIRYYVDPTTGETYVTEFVPGITEAEERTDESFNVKDYMTEQ